MFTGIVGLWSLMNKHANTHDYRQEQIFDYSSKTDSKWAIYATGKNWMFCSLPSSIFLWATSYADEKLTTSTQASDMFKVR